MQQKLMKIIQMLKKIIKKTLLKIGANDENIEQIIEDATKIEENSNQILDFTKKVKNMDNENKLRIIETLWRIIYSNKEADMYETSLMRRLQDYYILTVK